MPAKTRSPKAPNPPAATPMPKPKVAQPNTLAADLASPQPVYSVRLIHRAHDWDCELKFKAPNAQAARRWGRAKMADPDCWIIVSAMRVPASESTLG